MLSVLISLGLLSGITALYLKKNPQFGGRLEEEDLKKYALSKQWHKGVFLNQEHTSMAMSLSAMPKLLKEFVRNRKAGRPDQELPLEAYAPTDLNPEQTQFIWYGHSSVLLQLDGRLIWIDPMMGPDASPVGPLRTKRFSSGSLDLIDQVPRLDLVLLTHDHYDHLDYASIQKLKDKTEHFVVALGLERHLKRWGINEQAITEMDWWEEYRLENMEIIFTPSRHFSGRGTRDRAKSLWGGWVIRGEANNIYWSGDGGYGKHFKDIGEKYGPFDLGFMECGQYNERWHQIHMYPEEAVQAAEDSRVAKAVPVHWAGFTLALHPWKEPAERFASEAELRGLKVAYPELGLWTRLEEDCAEQWWTSVH